MKSPTSCVQQKNNKKEHYMALLSGNPEKSAAEEDTSRLNTRKRKSDKKID